MEVVATEGTAGGVDRFNDAAVVCADEQDVKRLAGSGFDLRVDCDLSVPVLEARLDDDRRAPESGHWHVHQRVLFDEVEGHLWQLARVIDTRTRSGFRNFGCGHWQPIGVHVLLTFELTVEGLIDVFHSERTNGRTTDTVRRSGEHTINKFRVMSAVYTYALSNDN